MNAGVGGLTPPYSHPLSNTPLGEKYGF